jgi:hypothetical protein
LNISNNLSINKPRLDRSNFNATVSLDITDIHILKKSIVPLYSKDGILKTKKFKDFNDWSFCGRFLLFWLPFITSRRG